MGNSQNKNNTSTITMDKDTSKIKDQLLEKWKNTRVNIILAGPYMSGKHTQANLLTDGMETVCHINLHDMLQKELKNNTDIGKKMKKASETADNVSDDIIYNFIEKKIDSKECSNGFVMTDFPRTVAHAEELDKMLQKREKKLLSVVDINVKYSELEDRFLGCLAHEASGRRYHEDFVPPKKPKKDNITGDKLTPCMPGTPEEFRSINKSYREQMAPVFKYYQSQGRQRAVDGNFSVCQVFTMLGSIVMLDMMSNIHRYIRSAKAAVKSE